MICLVDDDEEDEDEDDDDEETDGTVRRVTDRSVVGSTLLGRPLN